jgi:type VI secretion system secreted protein VgrG
MNGNLSASVASGDVLDVRDFHVYSSLSSLFDVTLTVLSDNPDIDFEAVIGQAASFTLHGRVAGGSQARTWSGLAVEFDQVRVAPSGLSTYRLRIAPLLWLTTQRRNHRVFQLKSELEIVEQLLGEWGIPYDKKIGGSYKTRKYRAQYGETDYVFMSRMLEDAGITFYFEDGGGSLVLSDAPQRNDVRAPPIAFRDEPTVASTREHVTSVHVGRRVRPGKYTLRDVDYRRSPTYPLLASATGAAGVEQRLERFHYTPGAFLFESAQGGDTPQADDRGKHRTDEDEGKKLAQKRLAASRGDALTAAFSTNVIDLSPGVVMTVLDHPSRALGDGATQLVTESRLEGERDAELHHHVEVRSAGSPYHPELRTPKPKVQGVETAVVVGPAGAEIHTDEFGRIRVQFHWDREGGMNEKSSCWIPVSHPWGGAGYGGSNLPRIGQEVLVDFLGGDPDRPMITGRVYTNLQKTPYKLPANKTQSGWKSNSSPTTGGYNEIMFEDAAGKELVRMQAEKDLHKLVKHDEQVAIGNDRTKQVGHDDTHVVGHDRTRAVGNDESVQVGNDRARQVGNDESVTVGNNRTKLVGSNESVTIGVNHSETIGNNRSIEVGGSHNESIGEFMGLNVGAAMSVAVALVKTETVGVASLETVGGPKNLEVGSTYTVGVGAAMSTTVGAAMSTTVGAAMSTIVGADMSTTVGGKLNEAITGAKMVQVGEVYELTCGPSKIHVDKDGSVVIEAKNITLKASGPVGVQAGATVKVEATGEITVKGSSIGLN